MEFLVRLYFLSKLIKAARTSETEYRLALNYLKVNLRELYYDIEREIVSIGPKWYLEILIATTIGLITSLFLIIYLIFDGVAFHRELIESSLLVTPILATKLNIRQYHHKPFFEEYLYPLHLEKLNSNLLLDGINSFNEDVVENTSPDDVIRVIIVIQYLIRGQETEWHDYRSLTSLVTMNRDSITVFKGYALHSLAEKSNDYHEYKVDNIIFRYRIDREEGSTLSNLLSKGPFKRKLRFTFDNYNLPLPNTCDFRQFGTIVREQYNPSDETTTYDISIPNKDYRLEVRSYSDKNLISIIREFEGVETRTWVWDDFFRPFRLSNI